MLSCYDQLRGGVNYFNNFFKFPKTEEKVLPRARDQLRLLRQGNEVQGLQ